MLNKKTNNLTAFVNDDDFNRKNTEKLLKQRDLRELETQFTNLATASKLIRQSPFL